RLSVSSLRESLRILRRNYWLRQICHNTSARLSLNTKLGCQIKNTTTRDFHIEWRLFVRRQTRKPLQIRWSSLSQQTALQVPNSTRYFSKRPKRRSIYLAPL